MLIFGILPLLSLGLFILLLRHLLLKRQISTDWRQAVLLAAVAWGVWLTFLTEGLSVFNLLEQSILISGWSSAVILLLTSWFILRDSGNKNNTYTHRRVSLSLASKIALSGTIFIVLITFIMAIFSAPNNWDSMTYHLSRVMHWTQNQSVHHYATHEVRQLYQSPWAEFAITQFYILSSSDYYSNMVQWLSMVGCLVGVSLIARQLGAFSDGQIVASFVTATIPMGILQAVTTQTDYVVSFWLVCFVSFILSARKNVNLFYLLGIAGSLGLALLTKATAYLYAAPFVIWFGLFLIRTYRWSFWRPTLIIGIVIILLNSGHYSRNFKLFGSPLKPNDLGDYEYTNQALTPAILLSNTVRSVALHFTLPAPLVVTTVESAVKDLHHVIKLDPSDPRTTWVGTGFGIDLFRVHEDTSGNFIHLVLIFITTGILLTKRRHFQKPIFSYVLLLVTSFFLFVLYLKWQPWHSRLHLPLFVLWGPVIAVVLSKIFPRWPLILTILILLIQTLPFIFTNPFHPLLQERNIFNLDRAEQYFLPIPDLQEPYSITTQTIRQKNCQNVGLNVPSDAWEYPFWVLLRENNHTVQLNSLDVENPSNVLTDHSFTPCAVICLRCQERHLMPYTEKFGQPDLHYGSNFLFTQ